MRVSMPVDFKIDAARRLIVATVFDEISDTEIIEALTSSLNDPDFERGFNVLSDHTRITQAITTEQVKLLVNHMESLSDHLAGARWAIVTNSPASYGMMRMLSVFAERVPIELRVFRDADEANRWLASTKS
jgi:hypothetical protein